MKIDVKQIPPVLKSFLFDLLKTSVHNLITRIKENRKAGEMLRLLAKYGTEEEHKVFENIISKCHSRYSSVNN